MKDLDISLPNGLDAQAVPAIVEEVCKSADLQLTMKTTLKKYPGCIHWHFKKGDQTGIVEATWWRLDAEMKPARLWLSVHGNRSADWIAELMPELSDMIETELASQFGSHHS